MARKKEPERIEINKVKIKESAKKLFRKNGIEQTKMEEIAKEAGMCKATLYTYYESREDIKNDISLEAMQYFYHILCQNTKKEDSLRDNFFAICHTLVAFKKKYEIFFQIIVEKIGIEEDMLRENATLKSIYETGECVNALLLQIMSPAFGKMEKEKIIESIFFIWGSIYGLLTIADNKAEYIRKVMHMEKEVFLADGFERLFAELQRS